MKRFIVYVALAFSACVCTSTPAASDAARDVSFFSEGVLCKGKLFWPDRIDNKGSIAAVVVAPGEGATRASIDSYAREFARRGIAALAIDYRGWGESGGLLYFGESVRWDDRMRFTPMTATLRIRRLRLDPKAQVIDIRNAITFMQGTAGIDRARIGVWGTDLAGGHALVTAASDARVKAVVAQRPLIAGDDQPRVAHQPTAEQQAAMIRLARSGAAPSSTRAAKSMNVVEAKLALAEYHPWWYLDQIPASTAVLLIVAEQDAKINTASQAIAASKILKGPTSVTTLAGERQAVMDGNDAAGAAGEWFAKYL